MSPGANDIGGSPIPTASYPASAEPAGAAEDTGSDQRPLDATEQVVRIAPPWLVSTIFHMLVIILLGLLYLPTVSDSPLIIDVGIERDAGMSLDDTRFTLQMPEPIQVPGPVVSRDLTERLDPLALMPEPDKSLLGVTMSIPVGSPTIADALKGRGPEMKKMLLARYGGTRATEAAVQRALRWLAQNQQQDGTWSLTGPYLDGGRTENRCAATAMALLAFQGAGNTHRTGPFRQQVARGMAALLKMQDRGGDFYGRGVVHHHLYSQALATIAVCELLGMTQDEQLLRQPAQRAIDYAVQYQAAEGGWRYEPGIDSDMSVTGWFVMALESGRMAGLEVPQPTLDNVKRLLNHVQDANGSRYAYRPEKKSSLAMTAEGLLCRQYLGWKRDDRRLISGVKYLLANPINWKKQANVYYWYYAAQVTHHMQGKYWQQWNEVMREVVPRQQMLVGKERGSWDPRGDRWGSRAGRLYTTCLCTFMLEVYYRHLPIYQYRTD